MALRSLEAIFFRRGLLMEQPAERSVSMESQRRGRSTEIFSLILVGIGAAIAGGGAAYVGIHLIGGRCQRMYGSSIWLPPSLLG